MEVLIALGVFLLLVTASLGMLWFHPRLATRHRNDETLAVLRLVAGIFTVMTSLVFGLLINSAKTAYETVDAGVHGFATEMILLDRTLRHYGMAGREARQALVTYLETDIRHPTRAVDLEAGRPDMAGQALDRLGDVLATIRPGDSYHEDLLSEARQQYSAVVAQRWRLIEQSEGNIPLPLVVMLVAWLMLIFASFGYRAPANAAVMTIFTVSAALIAASFYLVLDMDVAFSGPIQISDAPLHRALAAMRL